MLSTVAAITPADQRFEDQRFEDQRFEDQRFEDQRFEDQRFEDRRADIFPSKEIYSGAGRRLTGRC